MRSNPLAVVGLALLGLGAGSGGSLGSRAWAGELEPPRNFGCLNPGQEAGKETAIAAAQSIMGFLEEQELSTGSATIANDPIFLGGKPAMVIFVLQLHNADGAIQTNHILKILRDKLGVDTLFQEGTSVCPTTQSEATVQMTKWLQDVSSRCATPAELENAKISISPNSSYAPEWTTVDFPNSFGWEGLALHDYLDHCFTLMHHIGVEAIGNDLGRTGQSVFSLDGKYVSTCMGQMIEASDILAKRFPDTFPKLDLPGVEATTTDAEDGKPHELLLIRDQEAYKLYREKADKFFIAHEQIGRNVILAGNLCRWFRNPDSSPTVIAVVGEDHVLDGGDLSATQLLAKFGVSSVTVLAQGTDKQ